MRTNFILLILSIFVFACKKPSDRNCWKGAGNPKIERIEIESFNSIAIGSKLEVTLIQDTANYIEIIGFQNLNSKVKIEVEDQKLKLENTNKCDFLRKYDAKTLQVRIHFIELNSITFKGTAPLYTEGIITGNNLELEALDGASTINLNIDVQTFIAYQGEGFSDFKVTGQCNYSRINLANNGYCDLLGLKIQDRLSFTNESQADGKINIDGTTSVQLQTTSAGNILYKGLPINITTSELSTGKIYRIN